MLSLRKLFLYVLKRMFNYLTHLRERYSLDNAVVICCVWSVGISFCGVYLTLFFLFWTARKADALPGYLCVISSVTMPVLIQGLCCFVEQCKICNYKPQEFKHGQILRTFNTRPMHCSRVICLFYSRKECTIHLYLKGV